MDTTLGRILNDPNFIPKKDLMEQQRDEQAIIRQLPEELNKINEIAISQKFGDPINKIKEKVLEKIRNWCRE